MPELGTLGRRQIAALVGVALFNRDSGNLRGTRAIWGGRAQVRAVLYMLHAGGNATRPGAAGLYLRLRAAGKKPKVALIAACASYSSWARCHNLSVGENTIRKEVP